ncbi:hypothetical protein [uncultured Thiodictyon sp.]|uniref:hypothetical protein n=1 Tax=uncultured Thiodictyon sp. TaxID=1846217 RepID=UPI0025CF72BA|nr:hypothetical protein [uncultured Thiodictyon sp.]
MKEQADQLLAEIEEYLVSSVNAEVSAQLTENKTAIIKIRADMDQTNYRAAFVGKIGAGKTSAICRAVDLQSLSNNKEVVDLLKTGAGRVTVCEVRIEYATKYSIKIDPLSSDEVRRVVRHFAEFIWAKANKHVSDEDEGGNLLSEELTRCIRNMLGLTIEKRKEDGRWRSTDKALEFSRNCSSVEEVDELMYACLALESRTKTELWPSPEEAEAWKDWLKETFARINDGKNSKVSIPSLITICGPFPLKRGDQTWSIIDTRGIDSYIHREDIRSILDTEGIFPIVCSTFVDAPDADCRSFFDLAISLGLGNRIARDATLLILDKDESDKVADIDEDITDIHDRKGIGRSIREDQVATKISHDYRISPNVITFDSRIDHGSEIWRVLEERRSAYINSKLNDLTRLVSASQELLSAEGDKVSAFKRDVDTLVADWRTRADAHAPDWKPFGEYIGKVFSGTHHRRLAASIDRQGSFVNLDVYEAINQLARTYAVSFCQGEAQYIKDGLSLLKGKYPEFTNQVDSLECDFVAQLSAFSTFVGDLAKQHWVEQVKTFFSIWRAMEAEWGQGPGYKNRVVAHWQSWTSSAESIAIHNALLRHIASAWGRVLTER